MVGDGVGVLIGFAVTAGDGFSVGCAGSSEKTSKVGAGVAGTASVVAGSTSCIVSALLITNDPMTYALEQTASNISIASIVTCFLSMVDILSTPHTKIKLPYRLKRTYDMVL